MRVDRKRFWVATAVTILMVLAVIWAFPRLVGALPTSYRSRLPEPVLRLVTTPLPTALPAPAQIATVDLAVLVAPATATATLPPTRSPETPAAGPLVTPLPTATLTPSPAPTETAVPPPAQAAISGLQILPQKFNNCGPANLTIVLTFLGYPVEQLEIGGVVKPNYDDRNVSPHELRGYVQTHTPMEAAVIVGGDLSMLQRLIAAGHPVIIEKGYEGSAWEGWMGHYLTLYGYDANTQTFSSLDTFLGPWDNSGRQDSFATIARYWQQFNYTLLVVYAPEDAAEVAGLIGDRWQDEVGQAQVAAETARREITADPANAFAWFNLGSSLVTMAQQQENAAFYRDAAVAFDEARRLGLPPRMLWYQFAPYEAYLAVGRPGDVLALAEATLVSEGGQNVEETYYYLGRALAMTGDEAGAVAAWQQAVALNAGYAAAVEALTERP